MKVFLAIGILAASAAAASAQDIVRLKNGKFLNGAITFDGDSKSGFTLKRWDTGGAVFVLWSQVPDSEAHRIRNRNAGPEESSSDVMLDGVKLITSSREIIGVLVSEDTDSIHVKTKEGVQKAPKSAVQQRSTVKVRETDVYTVDELIAKVAKGIPENDYLRMVEVANYAKSLRAYTQAKDYYKKAEAVADPTKKGEIALLLEGIEMKIKEEAADKALVNIWKLASELKFDEALAAAAAFMTLYADSEIGRANTQMIATLEAKKKEFMANRDKILGEAVPEHWRTTRATLLSEYSSLKNTLVQARELVGKMDGEIAARVAKKLSCTAEEVDKHWLARTEKKIRKVTMGDGTWIYKGGQDGGKDFTGDPDAGKDDPVEDFKKKFGDKRGGGQDPPKKLDYGLPLETSQEWWERASSLRKEWLEAFYALGSSKVTKEAEEEKDCSYCRGNGKIKGTRHGKPVEFICHECHEVKKVLTVKYW